jgi:cysteinyl-tRNA synthetase
MYVCGPTVYDAPHLGHGRFSLVFDVLRRYLEWTGLEVRYVSNITDIDDKIIARAREEGLSEAEVARANEAVWWEAMDALGVARPTESPHATDYVDKMVALVGELLASGAAYRTSDGVYMSVEAVEGYGLLARQSLESLRAGARIAPGEEKRSPLDFALWKAAKPGEPAWEAPFGKGRPGWHTECVVMSLDLLGEDFDVHGGGADLAFPHHENERAQAVATKRRFARHWVHNGWVVDSSGEKMSKSLGNFTSLSDLLSRADPRAYRLLVLRSHYRSPIEVSPATVADATEALGRLDAFSRRFGLGGAHRSVGLAEAEEMSRRGQLSDEGTIAEFRERMDDDLDTPGALASIFELVKTANVAFDEGDKERAQTLAVTVEVLCGALGLFLSPSEELGQIDQATLALVEERDRARRAKDFATADRIRRELTDAGWVVEDSPDGTRLHRSR